MPRLNWNIIASNISEAREQLQAIEDRVRAGNPPKQVEFQIMMRHAFHHLNFAWNARHWATKRYAGLTKEDFQQAGMMPTDLDFED